jgi:hypothetical protein
MVALKRRQFLELQSMEFAHITLNNSVRACMSVTTAGRLQIYMCIIKEK